MAGSAAISQTGYCCAYHFYVSLELERSLVANGDKQLTSDANITSGHGDVYPRACYGLSLADGRRYSSHFAYCCRFYVDEKTVY